MALEAIAGPLAKIGTQIPIGNIARIASNQALGQLPRQAAQAANIFRGSSAVNGAVEGLSSLGFA